jgi:hypothetical protein
VRRDFNPVTRCAASFIAKIVKGLLSHQHLAMTIRVSPKWGNRKTLKQLHEREVINRMSAVGPKRTYRDVCLLLGFS